MNSFPLLWSMMDDFDGMEMSRARPLRPWYMEPFFSFHRWSSPPPALNFSKELNEMNKELSLLPASGKDGFQVSMDVAQFKPNELNVKVVDDCVMVEGKHEERKDDNGYVLRHFVRRYKLPEGADSQKIVSSLSANGILTISAPKPAAENKPIERIIQIQRTGGPAALDLNRKKHNSKDTKTNI